MSEKIKTYSFTVNANKGSAGKLLYYAKYLSKYFNTILIDKFKCDLGAVHMSRASPANRADLSHENLYFSTT